MSNILFSHLHSHTEYSLLDGSNRIRNYLDRVKDLGMTSAAITDHGVMYGAVEFYKYAKEIGVHPVIGCEVYVAPKGITDKSNTDRYCHLVLLAENNTGYENLCRLVSKGFTEGFYYRPRIDFSLLTKYHEGLIALSGCLAGEIPKKILAGNYKEACSVALKYQKLFGQDHFYLELQDHGIPEQKEVNRQLILMGQELQIPIVVTNDIHYTAKEDAEAHDVLICIQTKKRVSDPDRMHYEAGQYYVKSAEEMSALFPGMEEALENTEKIARRCQVEFSFNQYHLPKFEAPSGLTSWQYLNTLCLDGLKKKYPDNWACNKEKLDYELNVIKEMGFVDYFLIVWDFIHYAKSHGIPVGPGRGSAAGSIVSYCLDITEIDPLKYNLLFERFLNPERVTMPDIDVDFCYERRHEVIEYVVEKYGRENVAQIVTFGTLAARGVLKDVGKAMEISTSVISNIIKYLPEDPKITLENAVTSIDALKELYDKNPDAKKLIDTARKLEGLPRHTSTHAAGVVICPKPVTEFVPVCKTTDGGISTQYIMTTLEELGLLKMDFLGLRTLTVIQKAMQLAEMNHNKPVLFDYEDRNVYQYIGTGQTEGIFQLESGGMKTFMKQLKPLCMEDLIAGISLYRPGPMDFIPKYIDGRQNPDNISYEIPELEEILSPTCACIIYQEQVMQIVRKLAGYNYGRADLVRRAMSKKKSSVMEKERQFFLHGGEGIPGCEKNGIPLDAANHVYDQMIDFAKYAFNKSHAATYAVVAFQTAYLKYYYPAEYLASLMTSVRNNLKKTAEYLLLSKQMNIQILRPDIQNSSLDFSAKSMKILYSLAAIKDVGDNCVEEIIRERSKKPFSNFKNFLMRMQSKGSFNKSSIQALIKSGALDSFGHTRKYLMEHFQEMLDTIQYEKKNGMLGQTSLLSLFESSARPQNEEEYSKSKLLEYEKEVLGIYLSGHPLEEYYEKWISTVTAKSVDFLQTEEAVLHDGQKAVVGGIIKAITLHTTKNKKRMAYLELEDLLGCINVIVFPDQYAKYQELLKENTAVFCHGIIVSENEKTAKLKLEKLFMLSKEASGANLWIQYEDIKDYQQKYALIRPILKKYPGDGKIFAYLKNTRQIKREEGILAIPDERCLHELSSICGQHNVKIK